MLNVRGVKDVRALQKIAVEETRLDSFNFGLT
jgi:hypothetical protein